MRYFLELSYDGTRYAGWQKQKEERTVQGCIESALTILLKKETTIVGCGRTDRGVHAKHFIAHLDLDKEQELSPKDILYKLNRILDKDISCHRMIKMQKNAHARYDASARTYQYQIHLYKNPFLGEFSTYIRSHSKLKIQPLHDVATLISEQEDFASFCKLHGSNTGTLCKIFSSKWTIGPEGQKLVYEVQANRFLRGMVRLIVGSTLNVGLGKLTFEELKSHVRNGTRCPLMQSAPPQGLALLKIEYPYL